MKMRASAKKQPDNDLEDEPFSGALKQDLLDLGKRGKSVIARRIRVQQKLAKLLAIDPQQEAQARLTEHTTCIAAARKRVMQLRTAHLKRAKKDPPLLKQIKQMISREGI